MQTALLNTDLVFLATEWDEFVAMDPNWAGELVGQRLILDGRNALDREAWQTAGWTYRGIGRN